MATITVRIDDELKQNLDDVLNELKISQTEVIINTCKYIVQNKKLPFVVIEKLKTPEDLRAELIDKFYHARIFITDLESNLKSSNPIYPNQCNIIISILRGFANFFDFADDIIKNSMPLDEYRSLLAAYEDALFLANRLDDMGNYNDVEYILLNELSSAINMAVISFGRVLSIRKDIMRHFQVKLIENNITMRNWDNFEARLMEALDERKSFNTAVINLVTTGRKQRIRFSIRDNNQGLDAGALHHALIPFGFSREQTEIIINNCQTDIPDIERH